MTPDDEANLRLEYQTNQDPEYEKKPSGQARPNVLFAAGMAMGRDPKRTVLVQVGALRPFSDSPVRHILPLDDSSESRRDLAERLRSAGCLVDLGGGEDWRTVGSFQWHSCFISYSAKDEEFARRLHSRMRLANMQVWLAPEYLKGGKKRNDEFFSAIQTHGNLLLVLSSSSFKSEWIITEIRKAREIEKREHRRKLFPIRLVDSDTLSSWTCFDAETGNDLAVELREHFIPDFSNWKDNDAFERQFKRLQEDCNR